MRTTRRHQLSSRKAPRQERSEALVSSILKAAVRVLETEGATRFTTIRVAEKAGVSVGSLYQYFPNKAAILFRLQSDEWRSTSEMLRGILEDRRCAPFERLRRLVHAFIRSECEEATMRLALDDAAPLYRDAPEAMKARAGNERILLRFMRELLPNVSGVRRRRAGELIIATLRSVGKQFSEQPRTRAEIDAWSEELTQMFHAYLRQRSRHSRTQPRLSST